MGACSWCSPLSGHRLPPFSPGTLSLKCCPWLPAGLASAGSDPFPPPGLLPALPDLSGPVLAPSLQGARARLSPAEEGGGGLATVAHPGGPGLQKLICADLVTVSRGRSAGIEVQPSCGRRGLSLGAAAINNPGWAPDGNRPGLECQPPPALFAQLSALFINCPFIESSTCHEHLTLPSVGVSERPP